MTTVYAVSMGEYSDYTVRGVFTTPEKAHEWAAAKWGPDGPSYYGSYGLEEFELDEPPPDDTGEVLSISAYIDDEGPFKFGHGFSAGDYRAKWNRTRVDPPGHTRWDAASACDVNITDQWPGQNRVRLLVKGLDHDRVRKVWSEQVAYVRQMMTERGEWRES